MAIKVLRASSDTCRSRVLAKNTPGVRRQTLRGAFTEEKRWTAGTCGLVGRHCQSRSCPLEKMSRRQRRPDDRRMFLSEVGGNSEWGANWTLPLELQVFERGSVETIEFLSGCTPGHELGWEAGIRAERGERTFASRAKPGTGPSSHERAKRVKWLGVRDDFRNWLITAAEDRRLSRLCRRDTPDGYRGRTPAAAGFTRTSAPMSITIRSSPISTRPG